MRTLALVDPGSGVINLDQPGTYLHWSIFTVSVANLVLIAVMVVIFGVALLLPFPKGRTYLRTGSVHNPVTVAASGLVRRLHIPGFDVFGAAFGQDVCGRAAHAGGRLDDCPEPERQLWVSAVAEPGPDGVAQPAKLKRLGM